MGLVGLEVLVGLVALVVLVVLEVLEDQMGREDLVVLMDQACQGVLVGLEA